MESRFPAVRVLASCPHSRAEIAEAQFALTSRSSGSGSAAAAESTELLLAFLKLWIYIFLFATPVALMEIS